MPKSQGVREPQSQSRRSSSSCSDEGGWKESGVKRCAHADAEFPALGELSDQALRKRGVGWKKQHQRGNSNDAQSEALLQQHQQENAALQMKVSEARATTGSTLSTQLLEVVAENERLNRQLHGLHTSASALRQAIADARSLQMHLQQEAADARLLAVGLQAQLRDARLSSGGAAGDGAAVRVEGARLVRDCAQVFGLSADDVFGAAQADRLARQAVVSRSALDDRSLSLLQNTQALLGVSACSRAARDTAAPRPAVAAAAQQLSFGSFSPVARRRPPPQQALPGDPPGNLSRERNARVPPLRLMMPDVDGNREGESQSGCSPITAAASRMADMALQTHPKSTSTPPHAKMANSSCGLDTCSTTSTPGSGVSASSHIASRIASLQEKFAAAEQLLQGGSIAE